MLGHAYCSELYTTALLSLTFDKLLPSCTILANCKALTSYSLAKEPSEVAKKHGARHKAINSTCGQAQV